MSDPTPVESTPQPSTPEPVVKAAAIWGTVATLIVTVLGVLVSLGVLSSEQSAAVTDLVDYVSANLTTIGTVIVGVVGVVSGLVSAAVTAFTGRRQVTPVATLNRQARR